MKFFLILLVFLFEQIVFAESEKRIVKIFPYNPFVLGLDRSAPEGVYSLEQVDVTSKRSEISPKTIRELERLFSPWRERDFRLLSGDRVKIVQLDDSVSVYGEEDIVRAFSKASYERIKDIFDINLPGGEILKAQFSSGLSFKLRNDWRLILRPSRSKTFRFVKDF